MENKSFEHVAAELNAEEILLCEHKRYVRAMRAHLRLAALKEAAELAKSSGNDYLSSVLSSMIGGRDNK